MSQDISDLTLRRFPKYIYVLRSLKKKGQEYTSASELSRFLDIHHTQIRKDLALTGVRGIPKRGHQVEALLKACIEFLDWDSLTDACLVGVGSMGKALINYEGFSNAGLQIVAAFDNDPEKIDTRINNIKIYNTEKLKDVIEILEIKIAIIATPAKHSQKLADEMVAAGIKGIWNFTPRKLNVPDNVVVENMDIYPALAALLGKVKNISIANN
jgi:redox-sensing transcriptional repressor